MAGFRYSAIGKEGALVKGSLSADSPRQARTEVRRLGLAPLSVKEISAEISTASLLPFFSNRPSISELCLVTRQLAGLFAAKVPVEEAIRIAIRQTGSGALQKAMTSVRSDIIGGSSLSAALAKWPHIFSPLYSAITEAGEESGALDTVFVRLADYLEKSHLSRQRIGLALIYPAIVTLVAGLATAGILVFVIPQIVTVFNKTGQTLPFLTRALIAISDGLVSYGWLLSLILASVIVVFLILLRRPAFQIFFQELSLKAPLAGQLILAINVERFTQTLAMLMENGVSLLPALSAASKTITNLPILSSLRHVHIKVAEGSLLSEELSESNRFSELLIGYVESGERNGQLGEMLSWAAKQQNRELEFRVNALTAIFEPTLIVIMGGVTLLTALAILLPIFEMSQIVK